MTSDGSRMGARLPCHEYINCHFDQDSLEFTVHSLDTARHPILGNGIVESVVPNGMAARGGVQPLDVVVAINGKYVAFLSCERIQSELRNTPRPMHVTFARAKRNAWERICKDTEGVVKIGKLEKYGGTVMGRWQPRDFVLSRSTLSYYEDGTMKKKIGLEEIVQIIPPSVPENEFSLSCHGKEMKLKCASWEDAFFWIHAIESTKKGCFDNAQYVLSALDSYSGASKTNPPAAMSTVPQPAQIPKKAPPKPPIQRGPYYLLSKSLVMIKCDFDFEDTEVNIPHVPIIRSLAPVDLSLERRLLGDHNV